MPDSLVLLCLVLCLTLPDLHNEQHHPLSREPSCRNDMAKVNEESKRRAISSSWWVLEMASDHMDAPADKSSLHCQLGLVLTTAALIAATRSMRQGNRAQFNRMLRFRVAAQAFTVVGTSIRFPVLSFRETKLSLEAGFCYIPSFIY